VRQWLRLCRYFALRDFRQRYLNSLSGAAWALVQPLALLGIYALVFVHVLRVRLPPDLDVDIVPFLVAGLWPWAAFADALTRATNALPDNAGLLAKVALPRSVLVAAPVASGFAVQLVGFILVIAVLALLGYRIDWWLAPVAVVAFALFFVFALGLALLTAALNVFVRDLTQVVTQAVTLLFFLTPVFYTREMVPPAFGTFLAANPMSAYIEASRAALLYGEWLPPQLLTCAIAALIALGIGSWVFRRLETHFEDYL
jgi:ABC-type polysaccharide/polyol phosphate export permease